jgi:hypothetical protein
MARKKDDEKSVFPRVVFSGKMKEIKINEKGIIPVFVPGAIIDGQVMTAVNMAHNKSDLKITIEAVQASFFDDEGGGDEPEE